MGMGRKLGAELRKAIETFQSKLGRQILSEAEFSHEFLYSAVIPYLRSKIGLLADAKLERTIRKGRYDARIGSLLFEFERPMRGIDEGINQAKQYIEEYRTKGEMVRCFITDGHVATLVDERGEESETRSLPEMSDELQRQLSTLALMPAEPEDLLRILGPGSDISRSNLNDLLNIFRQNRELPFVSECFDLWRRLYGAAANLTREVVEAVRIYARGLGITLERREDVEEFLFVIETYISTFMKLLVAAVATQRELVEAPQVAELLSPPLASFEKLADRVPFLRSAFEHDAFSWFVDIGKRDRAVGQRVGEILRQVALALDKIDLSKVRIDLLRRVYQEFFETQTRKALGEFYTNEEIVEDILDSVGYFGEHILEQNVLDPACGSGTFLIVAIKRFIKEAKKKDLSDIRILEQLTRQIVGIDIHPFAVAMARVNYLLAISGLIDRSVRRAIGELVIPIYWTDSLASFSIRPEPTGVPVVEIDVAPLGKFFMPDPKEISWDKLLKLTTIAIEWGWDKNRYIQEFPSSIALKYKRTLTDLYHKFRERAKEGRDSRWLSTLRNVMIVDSLKGQCDFVVGNPPWVRIHNVDVQLRRRIQERFRFYSKDADWNPNFRKTRIPFRGQVDYSIAFVESALNYLKDEGSFGFVITSNVVRSLYAGKMRETLLENTSIETITDYSLSKVQLFEGAQNAPLILAFKKTKPFPDHVVKLKMVNRNGEVKNWEFPQVELPLAKSEKRSPWLLGPPPVIQTMRKMQKSGPRLGDILTTSMGIKTAANPIFLVKSFTQTDEPGVLLVETEGKRKIRIETELLRPMVRGRDIDEWHYDVNSYIIWTHDDRNGNVLTQLPQNAKTYFEDGEVKESLVGRDDYSEDQPPWTIFRVSKDKLKDKIAWQKIARVVEAAFLPEKQSNRLGRRKLLVDTSLYFVVPEDEQSGLTLTGLFNSTPSRAYAATFVNRTGAAYCQYFAWIVGLIPIPDQGIRKFTKEVARISREISKKPEIKEEMSRRLDEMVGAAYGLTSTELLAMQDFLGFFAN